MIGDDDAGGARLNAQFGFVRRHDALEKKRKRRGTDEFLQLFEGLGFDSLALRGASGSACTVKVDRERDDTGLFGKLHAFDDVLVETRLETDDGLVAEGLERLKTFLEDRERITDAVRHGTERAGLRAAAANGSDEFLFGELAAHVVGGAARRRGNGRHGDLRPEEVDGRVGHMHSMDHTAVELHCGERVIVGLEASACAHAAETGNLTDAGPPAVAFRTDVAARHHHFTGALANGLIIHFAFERTNLQLFTGFSRQRFRGSENRRHGDGCAAAQEAATIKQNLFGHGLSPFFQREADHRHARVRFNDLSRVKLIIRLCFSVHMFMCSYVDGRHRA